VGPSEEDRKAHNPFAVDKEQAVHMVRELLASKDTPNGQLSERLYRLRESLKTLGQNSPRYYNTIMTEAKKAGPLGADAGPNPAALKSKNPFAVDTNTAVGKVVAIMPYLQGVGALAAPAKVKAEMKALDDLRKLDPRFAEMIERRARERLGPVAVGGLGLSM
jgi:hypothetical protein